MAKGSHALGGSFRGRIGSMTLYVRNGKQILYKRTPSSREKAVHRHAVPNLVFLAAARWKKTLDEKGFNTSMQSLVRWASAVNRVMAGGAAEEVFSSPRVGTWSLERVQVNASGVSTPFAHRTDSLPTTVRWYFGAAFPYILYYKSDGVVDYPRGIYPVGSAFVSIVGSTWLDMEIRVGVSELLPGPYDVFPRSRVTIASQVSIVYDIVRIMGVEGVNAMWQPPTPCNYAYKIVGGGRPLIEVGAGKKVFAWAVIAPAGEFIVAAAASHP